MMKWFRRKRETVNREPNRALVQLVLGLERLQRRWADALGRKTQHWNRASKLIALGVFVLLFGGSCVWLVLRAFF